MVSFRNAVVSDDMKIQELLAELETSLLCPEVRSSKEKLGRLLSDDFFEIGASGRTYGKNEVLNKLQSVPLGKTQATDFRFRELAPGLIQVIYTLRCETDNKETRDTIRSSIWQLMNNEWQMLFHQGTVAESFE